MGLKILLITFLSLFLFPAFGDWPVHLSPIDTNALKLEKIPILKVKGLAGFKEELKRVGDNLLVAYIERGWSKLNPNKTFIQLMANRSHPEVIVQKIKLILQTLRLKTSDYKKYNKVVQAIIKDKEFKEILLKQNNQPALEFLSQLAQLGSLGNKFKQMEDCRKTFGDDLDKLISSL